MSIDITKIYDTVTAMWDMAMIGLKKIHGYDPEANVVEIMLSRDISAIQQRWYARGYVTTIFWGDDITLSLKGNELTSDMAEEMLKIAGEAISERVAGVGDCMRLVRKIVSMFLSGTIERVPDMLSSNRRLLRDYAEITSQTRQYLPREDDAFHAAADQAARRLAEIDAVSA